ncbi:hypothetical protein [Bacteroides cellulosilyticus]|jgi:hypothetical protein|uniref:hypothetical protein n=1 Tax=Bacteroides cellulosilyticus TaxID=246787 RepID=UPI00189C84DB|nr:hypothetical protein [Bacteroides cellulosilyticus]
MKKILILIFVLIGCIELHAQSDPTLSSMILLYTNKAKSELKSQEASMMLETTGHIWLKEEVDETTNIQRKFNDYLDSFHSIICYAAQIYGFYHEISNLTTNLSEFTEELGDAPSNALAVALSSRRNAIYRELIMGSVEIVNDIRQVCLSDIKMTEKERIEIVFSIRPKLKLMNRKLKRLTRAVKYTSMADVWAEIEGGARQPADKKKIVNEAMDRWKRNGRRGF